MRKQRKKFPASPAAKFTEDENGASGVLGGNSPEHGKGFWLLAEFYEEIQFVRYPEWLEISTEQILEMLVEV
ncbi:hypothetical protein CEXT_812801 [Caerostris extrusa]|uniref:Uncharacterized protein n=1 Tax=Caerostris extrusa TaxID=172846 RepID=A0AAV4NCQ5_CAEEX|nr:hypothetical protein CEXT_812801 [Caerostris extrusa]